ncbi:hypothetical protein [Methanogenium cariaci]|uniref:hypothetical protein n=1 Tax=Methanogenium cariaci TaxID=2197 RepID=UPI000785E462|nr:hypothetical protein [Methanogenium cariaci]
MEGLDADNIDQHSIECYGDSCPATGTDTMPYATGDIPAPIVMVWPDTDTIDVYRATEAGGEVFPPPGLTSVMRAGSPPRFVTRVVRELLGICHNRLT